MPMSIWKDHGISCGKLVDDARQTRIEETTPLGGSRGPQPVCIELIIRSKISKPPMRQCLLRGQPLRRIKVRQATNKIFEVRVNILPHGEWLPRLGLVEAVSNNFEDPAPRTVAKVFQERVQSVFIRKIRNLTLQDDRQWLFAFRELIFADGEDDTF